MPGLTIPPPFHRGTVSKTGTQTDPPNIINPVTIPPPFHRGTDSKTETSSDLPNIAKPVKVPQEFQRGTLNPETRSGGPDVKGTWHKTDAINTEWWSDNSVMIKYHSGGGTFKASFSCCQPLFEGEENLPLVVQVDELSNPNNACAT